jgi:DNA-binding transcriptional regulator YiaG
MKLADFLDAKGLSDEGFAALVGNVSVWGVRKWRYGQRTPRPREMARIVEVTQGVVTANDFLPAPAASSGEAA